MTDATLFEAAAACLTACDLDEKVRLTHATAAAWRAGHLGLEGAPPPEPIGEPGRPGRPKLVRPRELTRRSPHTREGRAVLHHALAHIEFNAINLGWDAVYRFRGLPRAYYDDWVRVADEEAFHFTLLRDHLRAHGHDYGDFPGHDGLWEMAKKTAHDGLARMALVPRCLEARGLDVNPGIQERLLAAGDEQGAALLDTILQDEIGHVGIGDRWFRYHCGQRSLEPETTYRELLARFMTAPPRGPFHQEARRRAGFSDAELAYLESAV